MTEPTQGLPAEEGPPRGPGTPPSQPAPPPGWTGPPAGYGPPGQPGYGPPHYAGTPGPGVPPSFAYPGLGGSPGVPPLSAVAQRLGWVIAGLGALTFVFAFLPWATAGPFSVSGVQGGDSDGLFTLTFGLICVGTGLVRALGKNPGGVQLAMPIISLVMGGFTTVVALADIGRVSDLSDDTFFPVSVGAGLVLTLLAGLALVAVSIVAVVKRR